MQNAKKNVFLRLQIFNFLKTDMKKYICFLLIALTAVACTRYPYGVEQALKLAGDNRAELECVLERYRAYPEDSLKFRAACFLIENMPGHASLSTQLINPSGQIYTDFVASEKEYDSLIHKGYSIKKTMQQDITHINCDYLLEQIELAFEAWTKPWSRNVNFDDFCRYILPYRAQTELLSSFRGYFLQVYGQVLDTVPGLVCPLEACRIINRILSDSIRYHFDLRWFPLTRSVEDTKNSGLGLCEDLCNFGIHTMRAVGIPVVIDRTLWARMNLGHSWCLVLCADGRWHAFGAGEDQPGELLKRYESIPERTISKVWRMTYERIKDERRDSLLKNPVPQALFSNTFAYDVTAEYVEPTLINVNIDSHDKYAFLSVFNHGQWQAADYSPVKQGQASFRAGKNIVYMFQTFRNGVLIPYSEPFLLLGSDSIRKFIPNFEKLETVSFNKIPDLDIQLLFWDVEGKTWKEIPSSGSNDTELFFDMIPENALLRHNIVDFLRRIGIIIDGSFVNY